MKKYEAPKLFVDEYMPDTMIASGGGGRTFVSKNGNANNQNCYGKDTSWGSIAANGDYCIY